MYIHGNISFLKKKKDAETKSIVLILKETVINMYFHRHMLDTNVLIRLPICVEILSI